MNTRMYRLLGKIFKKQLLLRIVKWTGISVIVLALVVLTTHWVFNAQVEKAWKESVAEWQSKIEGFERTAMFPVIANEENIMEDPVLKQVLKDDTLNRITSMEFEGVEWSRSRRGRDGWTKMIKGKEFQTNEEAARFIIGLLEKYDAQVRGVEKALNERKRLQPRLAGDLELHDLFATDVPMKLIVLGNFFSDRASLHLAIGDNEAAFDDLQRIYQMVDLPLQGKGLVELLVAEASNAGAREVIREGVNAHAFDDEQLRWILEKESSYDWRKHYEIACLGEAMYRVTLGEMELKYGTKQLQEAATQKLQESLGPLLNTLEDIGGGWDEEFDWEDYFQGIAMRLIPSRYSLEQNRKLNDILLDDYLLMRESPGDLDMILVRRVNARDPKLRWYDYGVRSTLSAMRQLHLRCAKNIVRQILCCTGLALERYYLANHRYPDSLDQLVPRYLDEVPDDPFSGAKIQYALDANRKPILHSVGPTLSDEYGAVHHVPYGVKKEDQIIRFQWAPDEDK